jgi:hypothetical protein
MANELLTDEPEARTMAALDALDQAVAEFRETHTGPASSLYLRGWADAAKHLRRLLAPSAEPADEPAVVGPDRR